MRLQDATGRFLMSLDDLRQKVAFHNSVDVWIAVCSERNLDWANPEKYKRFIAHLLQQKSISLKTFNLCAHEAGAVDDEKTRFVEALAQSKDSDPNSRSYTIRLNDAAVSVIRAYLQ